MFLAPQGDTPGQFGKRRRRGDAACARRAAQLNERSQTDAPTTILVGEGSRPPSDVGPGAFCAQVFPQFGRHFRPERKAKFGRNLGVGGKKIGNGDETWRKKTSSQDFSDFPRI